MNKLELARQRAVSDGWNAVDTAPKDGTLIIVRFMHGYVSAEWSEERNYWVATPEVGGGEIPGPIYGWCATKQRGVRRE